MYALSIRFFARCQHTFCLREQNTGDSEPSEQFIGEDVQANHEILRILPESVLTDLGGNKDYPLLSQKPIISFTSTVSAHPSQAQEDGSSTQFYPPGTVLADIHMEIGPKPNPNGILLVSKPEEAERQHTSANGKVKGEVPEKLNGKARKRQRDKRNEQRSNKSITLCQGQLQMSVGEKGELLLRKIRNLPPGQQVNRIRFTISFRYAEGGIGYKTTFVLHIRKDQDAPGVHPLFRGIIDFGSDAIQMCLIQPNGNQDDIDILDKITHHFFGYAPGASRGRDLFFQEIEGKLKIFKNEIFIKQEGGKSVPNEPPGGGRRNGSKKVPTKKIAKDWEELVSILTSKHMDYKGRFLAPNLKLVILENFFDKSIYFNKHTDNPDPRGSNEVTFSGLRDYIYRIALNKFLHTLFKVTRAKVSPNYHPYFHLTLLVPNVYRQELISKLMKWLAEDWQTTLYKTYKFSGLEVQVMSESDATFLGMLSQKDLLNPKFQDKYLIIDCGKGTTDLSIIRVDKEGNNPLNITYSSIYRDGIVGGGNLITYGFIETILATFYTQDVKKRRDFMQRYLLDNDSREDISVILDFLKLIETLKRRYSDPNTVKLKPSQARQKVLDSNMYSNRAKNSGIQGQNPTPSLQDYLDNTNGKDPIKILNNWMRNVFHIGNTNGDSNEEMYTIDDEEFGFVKREYEALINKFCKNLEGIQLNGASIKFTKILFAGRAFLFEPFFLKMKSKLKEKGFLIATEEQDKDLIRALDPKGICLHGARGQEEVNRNSTLIGIPFVHSKLNGVAHYTAEVQHASTHAGSTLNGHKKGNLNGRERHMLDKEIAPSVLNGHFQSLFNKIVENFKRIFITPTEDLQPMDLSKSNLTLIDNRFFQRGSKLIKPGHRITINGSVVNDKDFRGKEIVLFYGGERWYYRTVGKNEEVLETRPIEFITDKTDQNDSFLIKTVFPFINLDRDKIPVSPVIAELPPSVENVTQNEIAKEALLETKYLLEDDLPDFEEIFGEDVLSDDSHLDKALVGQSEEGHLSYLGKSTEHRGDTIASPQKSPSLEDGVSPSSLSPRREEEDRSTDQERTETPVKGSEASDNGLDSHETKEENNDEDPDNPDEEGNILGI